MRLLSMLRGVRGLRSYCSMPGVSCELLVFSWSLVSLLGTGIVCTIQNLSQRTLCHALVGKVGEK